MAAGGLRAVDLENEWRQKAIEDSVPREMQLKTTTLEFARDHQSSLDVVILFGSSRQ